MTKKTFLIILCAFAYAFSQAKVPDSLKIMTFNIRYDNPHDGENRWETRKPLVKEILRQADADIICIQEGLYHQVMGIQAMLPTYKRIGTGRDDGKLGGEFCAIYYRIDCFKIDTSGTFWLSEQPDVPGSKSWNTACTRIVSWAKFSDLSGRKSFYVLNTHFDHMSEQARLESAKLINKFCKNCGELPVILCGDFNCTAPSSPIETLRLQFNNSKTISKSPPAGPQYTFCGFNGKPEHGSIIDHIFVRNIDAVKSFEIIDDYYDFDQKTIPSDHLPITLEILY